MQPDFSPQPSQSVILSEVEIARSAFSTQSKDPYNLHVTAAIFEPYPSNERKSLDLTERLICRDPSTPHELRHAQFELRSG
jgi:hypothetical protein